LKVAAFRFAGTITQAATAATINSNVLFIFVGFLPCFYKGQCVFLI
jgi:hypothetical protein